MHLADGVCVGGGWFSACVCEYPCMLSVCRVGLMGNPSDGFYGKTIALSIENFWAEVTISGIQHSRGFSPIRLYAVYRRIVLLA